MDVCCGGSPTAISRCETVAHEGTSSDEIRFTGFPPYHTRSWSWSPFWSVSLIKTPQPHHESPGLWRVLSVFFFFATDRVFKRCWLIVVRISLYHSRRAAKGTLPFTVCQRKSQTRPQGIREGRLQAKPKRDVQRCWWRLVLFRYLNPMSLLLFKYQSALACATISLSGIIKSPIISVRSFLGRQVTSKTVT